MRQLLALVSFHNVKGCPSSQLGVSQGLKLKLSAFAGEASFLSTPVSIPHFTFFLAGCFAAEGLILEFGRQRGKLRQKLVSGRPKKSNSLQIIQLSSVSPASSAVESKQSFTISS